MTAIKAGLSSYQAWQAAQLADANGAIGGDGSYWGVSLSLGSQHSQSQQLQKQTTNQAGTLTAGRDVAITATGNQGAGGDILLQGTQVKAGRDISLDAKRDVLLLASADPQTLSGKNSSGGGSIGASIGGGTDGIGITVFANVNAGRGTEKGNGVSWNETTLDAGRQASLNSDRDTALEGAQVSADQVVVNAGRDLLLSSSQDSNDYASRQQNISGGLGFTFGTMNVSGNISLAQDRLKSTFDSVQEQTGLFAGKSGYQVTVGNHTQLDGAVIGSTASSDKNSQTTGTLGWTNLHNQANFTAQHQSVSLSSGGSLGSQFAGNMASTLLAAANHSGHDSSTTHAAVSPGALLLTKPTQQTQNVATINTDVAHAANALSPIFDKEKEQQRLQQVQQIADIGNQVMDVIRTQGAIEAANARKDPVALEAARQALVKGGNNAPTADEIAAKAGNTAMQQYGTGSSLQRAAQAVTAAVQGLAGGNLQAAISGAAAPYLANTIKQLAGDNDEARIMAQAVLGAVVAKAQGNSPAAGAAGAAVGELIAAALYPDTKPQDLPEDKRQLVVLLSTLAAGLAGGLVGGTAADGLAGAQAGQTAVENNHLSQTDRIALDQKKRTYTADCSGAAAASTGCQALYKDIGELEDKGRSILQLEQIVVGNDMGQDVTQAHPPGEVVPCAGSGNGYCVVSNTAVQTQDGLEWALTPANDVQAQAALTKNQQDGARLDNDSRINGEQLLAAGCAGPGVVSALCQGYFTLGGENPFTGQPASTSDRVGYGLDLALQLLPFLALESSGAKGIGEASGSAKNFSIADRVFGQLDDPRMGQLAGKLDADALQKLANNPGATRFMDARSGHINVIQEIEGKLIRITMPRDEMKIISVGPIRPNQVKNLLGKGDFVPLP